MKKSIFLSPFLLVFSSSLLANTYTVTKTIDNTTTGTLRWAITQANANAGYDIIDFNIGTSGNTFESSGADSWAVITLASALPVITETVYINGTTQPNSNTGAIAGRTVGVNAFVQGGINYPDVYIVCGYSLPSSETGTTGNGLTINAADVTISGLAISGFGNTNTSQASAIAHADISIMRSASARTVNTVISNCFISCDPRGDQPSTAARRSKSSGILILGNNNYGTVERNLISHCGGYGMTFHATIDNTSSSPNIAYSTHWLIQENQVINIGRSTTYSSGGGRAADGISLMTTSNCHVLNNYVADWEQFGIDLGHNTDDNKVENNTVTGFVKTIGSAPCGGVRTGFSSERDSIILNEIHDNTSSDLLGGIWADESTTSFAGATVKNNRYHYYAQNKIYNNSSSGITLSTNGSGSVSDITITQNSIYNNSGLAIDLNFNGLTGPSTVSVNDNGDGDGGPNGLQNFPIIDSVKFAGDFIFIWGKAPATSTIEFFLGDGQLNNHGGLTMSYGEGKTYIGTLVEGSSGDLASGTGSYNFDGNVAVNNNNMFYTLFSAPSIGTNDTITATATLNGNTSEFGPKYTVFVALDVELLQFNAKKSGSKSLLQWEAVYDSKFEKFILEHSPDGTNFSTVYSVTPPFDSVSIKKFSYEHGLLSSKNFYRLKMVNKDGSTKYSKVMLIHGDNNHGIKIKILNNPFRNDLALNIDLVESAELKISLVDASGKIINSIKHRAAKGQNSIQMNGTGRLHAGMYNVVVESEGRMLSEQVIKQ